ncbi:hypothetical protein XENOCAPTIV_012777 [Xenoophorus captivus]|uniref:Uncharacterized protein n=1 Tax=Xenoophorus captivus TaxID=1517983 RepID=A0ABV0R028_9TELE
MSVTRSVTNRMQLRLVRKWLGSGGLCGCLLSQASALTLQPCFCFHSRRCLRILHPGMVIHGDPGLLAMSVLIVCVNKFNPNMPFKTNSLFKEILPAVDVCGSTDFNQKQRTYKQTKAVTGKS